MINKKLVFRIVASFCTVTLLCLTMACSGMKTSKLSVDNTKDQLERCTLTVLVPGEKPIQQDEVSMEISNKTRDVLNIDLNMSYIGWGDYINQVRLKSISGENFDICLNFSAELAGNIARKQCLPLNNLLDTYGADLKKQIPQNLWDSVTVDGKIYGIPAVYAMTEMGRGLLVRKDIREKYRLPEIQDQSSLEMFLDTIAKNEKDMIAILTDSLEVIVNDKDFIGHVVYRLGGDTLGYMYIDLDSQEYKVENYFKTPVFKRLWQENIRAYKKGWFEKDILSDTNRDYKFISGKAAAMAGDLYNIVDRQNQLQKYFPNAEIELAVFNKEGRWLNVYPVNNYAMISATGTHPDRAIMFMNWLRQSQENYDLMMLGIKGKTYNINNEQAEVPAGSDPKDRYSPTPWFTMHLPYLRTWTTDSEEFKRALEFWKELKPENSPLAAFAYTSENVKAESLAVRKLVEEIGRPLNTGMISSQEEYESFLKELDRAGMELILKDTQNQINKHLAKSRK